MKEEGAKNKKYIQGGQHMSALNITKNNFREEVLDSKVPVLLDFWAPWCGPCRMVLPIVESLGAEQSDFVVGKINVEDEHELAREFGVISIPTLVVMKNGQVVNKAVGAKTKDQILSLVAG